ncbi:hypothetical protein D0Z07_3972 [Hyphodiscus hymeniophilus]|uniref:SUZ-C domain-containing protein n=1 Tax=Hyphodiscus hymeniophilus TaxID=353542 RepID=A0A9P6VLU7_9HELO|nr:hypothetical protein D0Z07_3972 [Hyphodiscus hymeniophilus]
MSKKSAVPDAWDDDWESQADKADAQAEKAKAEEQVKVSKAERLARHAETNKKIWESAETPETFHFLAARDNVPLKTEFKPALKVLSRKPVVQKVDPVTGLAKMTLDDEDDEELQKKDKPTPGQLRLQAQRQRDEKQKRYEEARARIMGTKSGSSTPGAVTPPITQEDGKGNRGKVRGRDHRVENRRPDSQSGSKELFDPNYTPKPGVQIQKRDGETSRSGTSTPRHEEQVIRAPKGPDGTGRGGFGFAHRGGKPS